jgi:hypothetical protein
LRTAIAPESNNKSVWKAAWKALTISGTVLALVGYGSISFAYISRTSISLHLAEPWLAASLICCALAGVACLSIGQVGWALHLGRSGRARITAFGFAFPIAVAIMGSVCADGELNGAFPIFILPMVPLIFVAFILLWLW